jgi:hypothetical protein
MLQLCHNANAIVSKAVKILGAFHFAKSIGKSLTFEPESQLTQIEAHCFQGCTFNSLLIPRSVEISEKHLSKNQTSIF